MFPVMEAIDTYFRHRRILSLLKKKEKPGSVIVSRQWSHTCISVEAPSLMLL